MNGAAGPEPGVGPVDHAEEQHRVQRQRALAARAGSRAINASTARDDPALLGDDLGAARRRQIVELVQQHLVAVLRRRHRGA